MGGPEIVQGLIARGYSPVHAAALAGHALQESGGDTAAFNPKEDAHGLLQWRQDRWDNLQALAKARGVASTDPNVQLDFIGHEMAGPEAKAGSLFRSTIDLPSASAALKKYIRFGDDSDETRLNNARGLLQTPGVGMVNPQATLLPSSSALPAAGGGPQPAAPAAVSAEANDAALTAALANIPKMLQAQQQNQVFAPAAVAPDNLRARMAAIAAARQGQSA